MTELKPKEMEALFEAAQSIIGLHELKKREREAEEKNKAGIIIALRYRDLDYREIIIGLKNGNSLRGDVWAIRMEGAREVVELRQKKLFRFFGKSRFLYIALADISHVIPVLVSKI